MFDDRALTIYVDGSMRDSPRRGGIGVRFVWVNDAGDEETWDHALPATMGATNNEMELEAPSEALRLATADNAPFALSRFDKIVVRTDSEYVHGNLTNAMYVWPKHRWMKADGGHVLNAAAWKTLLTSMKRMGNQHRLRVNFEWSRGKEGRHAKAVDKLAKQSSNSPSFGRARPNLVRRRTSSRHVEPGSVKMLGQVARIRVIEAQHLDRQTSRYKYEIVDEASAFHEMVDWVESDIGMKVGHTYSVRFNGEQRDPRVEELIEEVEENLSEFLDALGELGRASTARQVADQLARRSGRAITSDAARLRLDKLAEKGQVSRNRAAVAGRPFVYELPRAAEEPVAEGDG